MCQLYFWFLLLTAFSVKMVKSQLYLRDESDISVNSSIEIVRGLRTYRHGPIEGSFLASVNDDIVVTAGGIKGVGVSLRLSTYFDNLIRRWAMWEELAVDDDSKPKQCQLMRIYNYGEEALFRCNSPGIYRAYALDECISTRPTCKCTTCPSYNWAKFNSDFNLSPASHVNDPDELQPTQVDFPEKKKFWSNRFRLKPFNIELKYKDLLGVVKTSKVSPNGPYVVVSDPFSIDFSDYCYYWNYRINKLGSTGKVAGAVLTESDSRGSYSSYDIYVWIIEPSATTYDEVSVDDPSKNTIISEYSRIVTKRFQAKGLVPCVRRAHGTLEVISIKWFPEEDAGNLVHYPYWSISIKLHEDRVISTLTDISFTVASRQRVSLYKCFVGDTRIFLTLTNFHFIGRGEQPRKKLNVELSNVDRVRKDYIRNNQYIYGHGLVWSGPLNSRIYQPGSSRTDMLTITNPCKSLEFLAIAGGRIILATGLIEKRMASMKLIFVPGLQLLDAKPTYVNGKPHLDYYTVADASFTPTHLVLLMTDSSVYLHPYKLDTNGIGLLSETKKFRLGALVKRRWCAQTGYLTHNMLVPAFSQSGNFILIQLFPIEGSVNIWTKPATESCAAENQGFVGLVDALQVKEEDLRNETEIHLHERVSRSNEVGGQIKPPKVERPAPKQFRKMNELKRFLANNGQPFDDTDPHFSDESTNPASKKLGTDLKDYNQAVLYKLDDTGAKIINLMKSNGLQPKNANNRYDFTLDNIQFTAVEKRYIFASRFRTDDIDHSSRSVIVMISTLTALDYPVKILRKKYDTDPDPELETSEIFPGCLLVRKLDFSLQNEYPISPDDIDPNTKYGHGEKTPVHITLYTLNTALPTYVADIGDVYIFASLDGRFARPLSYYNRSNILNGDPLTTKNMSPKFSRKADVYHDIVVTEQGTVSVLWRKKQTRYDAITEQEAQSIAIGSVSTIEPLREIQPFALASSIFQWATQDNEILYGKHTELQRPYYHNCDSPSANSVTQLGCIKQPNCPDPTLNTKCLCDVSHFVGRDELKPISDYVYCEPWTTFPFKDADISNVKDLDLKKRLENFKTAYEKDKTRKKIDDCAQKPTPPCFHKYPNDLCDPGEPSQQAQAGSPPPACVMPLPKHLSSNNLYAIELLGTPYYNLLKGNLQFPEKTTTTTKGKGDRRATSICPFSGFKVVKTDFDYAEIGYSTRITAEVSYFGKNIPREADLLVEYENVIGIKVDITSSVSEGRDQTTVTRTIDINFQMTDSDLRKMESGHHKKLKLGETTADLNLKDDARIFSITLRPSIATLYCNKDEIITTLQINVGCNPFSKMRLIAEATPLNKMTVKTPEARSAGDSKTWVRDGDFLSVPRETVHYKQRLQFNCKHIQESYCKIPYANLYGTNIFEISWRDPLLPIFEQFLTGYTRRVTGNIAIYDLLGNHVALNLTRLQAGCYNNAQKWHHNLQEQQVHLGGKVSVHEDIYKHYKDCYDQSLPRETPMLLSNSSFRLHNITNRNAFIFKRNPNPRNKIHIFRAVVVNTYYNRFTFCPNLDTFFLVKITGIPPPRQALHWKFTIAIMLVIFFVLVLIYIYFSLCYPWRGDMSDEKIGGGNAGEENTGDGILNEESLKNDDVTQQGKVTLPTVDQ